MQPNVYHSTEPGQLQIAKAAAAGFETLTILIIRGDEVTPVVVKL